MIYFSLNNKTIGAIAVLAIIVPQVTFAANAIVSFVAFLERMVSALFPLMVAAAILAVGWNLVRYLSSKISTDQDVYKAGILNSLLGAFVIFITVGLIKVLAGAIGVNLGDAIGVADNSGLGMGAPGSFRYIALTVAKFISNRIVPIMIACAMLFFFGNIIVSMTKSNVEEERTKLNEYMKWGILALFLILTLFSVVGLFTGSFFGIGAIIPQFQTS